MNNRCQCDNEKSYEECCGKFIAGDQQAHSAVELMRSRYTAYVLRQGAYLYETCSERLKDPESIEAIKQDTTHWFKLEIETFSEKEVTFIAYYFADHKVQVMKEHSFFIQEDGVWKYDRGEILDAKISRNEPCPCGSGKKYKKCQHEDYQ
jgi:SEC-C motif-containing protein